jgi:hypothetical protein
LLTKTIKYIRHVRPYSLRGVSSEILSQINPVHTPTSHILLLSFE